MCARTSGLHSLSLLPDGADDVDVAATDEQRGDEEQRQEDEGEVELPLPRLLHLDPALGAVALRLLGVVQQQDGRGEDAAEEPGHGHQDAGPPPAPAEVHGVGDGVVAVDAERHQHVVGGVGDDALQEADDLAGHQAGVPGDGDLPDDVRQHGDEADAEVRGRQVLDEEVHAGLVSLGEQQGDEDGGVAHHNNDKEDPEEGQLLRLVEDGQGRGGGDGGRQEASAVAASAGRGPRSQSLEPGGGGERRHRRHLSKFFQSMIMIFVGPSFV